MVAHVLDRLRPQVASVAINANQNLEAYGAYGVPVWPDDTPGFAGPLAGLEAGLRRCATPYLLSAPCDSPFLPPDLAARLLQGLENAGADLALAVTEENGLRQPHPVFCIVKSSKVDVLSAYLAAGGRRAVDRLAICAGAYSHLLARMLGEKVPLEAERGYHLVLPDPGVTLTRSLTYASTPGAATPMEMGLRLAGDRKSTRLNSSH